ncbi:MAG TPA: DUF1203 domain-containing protein [Rhizomicrobium sp.]|nr:DUF1203 domain-containing protein [Rhizomicrobium sp.]
MPYRITGLSIDPFRPLFRLSEQELNARSIRRMIADEKPGFPCRITLEDAEPGESLLLLNHEHQPADTPYRASGPIFVRENAVDRFDRVGEIPPVLRPRLLSLRGYDIEGMMVDADVVEGTYVESLIERLLANEAIETVHVHYARRGCFACAVERV